MLADIIENHFLRDRRDAEQARLAPVTLDVVVFNVAVTTVRLHCAVVLGQPSHVAISG